MKARHLSRRSLTRVSLSILFLVIALVPGDLGAEDPPSGVICPNCCWGECFPGTWISRLMLCAEGGNGSCLACVEHCGPFYPTPTTP